MDSNRFLGMRLFVFVNKHRRLICIEWMGKALCFWHWDIWRDMYLLKNLCSQNQICHLIIVNHSCPLLQISLISLEEEGISEPPSLKKESGSPKGFFDKILMPIYPLMCTKEYLLKLKCWKKLFDKKSAEVREGADVGIESDISFYYFYSEADFFIVIAFY